MRNLKKEAEWDKNRYKRYQYRCPKDVAEQLDKRLLLDNTTFSQWLKEKIVGYVRSRGDVSGLPTTHTLKTIQPYFSDVKCGLKQFDIRRNDRDFRVGDMLVFSEYDIVTERFTGAVCTAFVTYICDDDRYCKTGYIVMGISLIDSFEVT